MPRFRQSYSLRIRNWIHVCTRVHDEFIKELSSYVNVFNVSETDFTKIQTHWDFVQMLMIIALSCIVYSTVLEASQSVVTGLLWERVKVLRQQVSGNIQSPLMP